MPKKKVIYMPIETISKKEDFPEEHKEENKNYWKLFQSKQKEINLLGRKLSVHLKRKHADKVSTVKHLQKRTVETISQLNRKDTIYVHSHGSPYEIGLNPYGLKAKDVANRLSDDGLSKASTPRIKLWSCNSGYKVPIEKGRKKDKKTTFAKEVGKELVKLGYLNFSIFGYNGLILEVDKKDAHKKLLDNKTGNDIPAKKGRLEYKFKN